MLSSVQMELIKKINDKLKDSEVHGFLQYNKDLCYIEATSKDDAFGKMYTYQPSTDTLKIFNPGMNITRFKEINSKIFRF